MKQIICLATMLAAVLLVACSKGEVIPENPDPVPSPTESITIPSSESTSFSFDESGGTGTLSFSATENWVASIINNRSDSWCSIEPESGTKGNHTITIKAAPNEDPDNKTAVIQLKAGSTTKTINVSQKQKDALTLTSDRFEVPDTGGEVEIEVKANVEYAFAIDGDGKEWITHVGSRALATSTLLFRVAANETKENREATITISSEALTEKVTIYQNASGPAIIISQKEYTVSAEGETIKVEVSSNVDVEWQISGVDWITENVARAYSTNTYYFVVAANEDYDSRKAEIIFRNKESDLEETVVVYQLQKNAIAVAEKEYVVPSVASSLDFNVDTNIDFDVTVEADWIRRVESRGLVSKALHFDIDANTGEDERKGKIILSGEDIRQEITVIQKGETQFDISERTIEVGSEGGTFDLTITSNIGYKIEPSVDWIREVTSRAADSYVHKFEVSVNPTAQSREGVIVVCNDEEVCIPVVVKQEGGTPVESGWEDGSFHHRSLVMRFTADWCGYCPGMATNVAEAQRRYPDKIEAIHVHGSGNLAFEKVETLMELYQVTAYPSGLMDMRQAIWSVESIKEVLDETESNYPTQTGIGFYSTLVGSELDLKLMVYAKVADDYKVTVFLVEDNVIGWQADFENGEKFDYVHNGVARMVLTDVLGDNCATVQANQVVEKHYKVTIPSKYKVENLRIVAYVQRPFGNQPVISMTDFEGYYVDNCVSGKAGSNLKLAVVSAASGDGNEDIIPGKDIDF